MSRLVLTSLMMLITAYNIGLASTVITMKTYINKDTYNINDEATLTCAISSDTPTSSAVVYAWYKRQDEAEGYKLLGRAGNSFEGPFKNNDKYDIPRVGNGLNTANFTLSISPVEAEDAGDYKCEVTRLGDGNASFISLIVNPDPETPHLSFETNAPKTGACYFFNDSYGITCSGNAQTNNRHMSLIIMEDGTDITHEFKNQTNITWTPGVGLNKPQLKEPSVFHKLEAISWQPTKAEIHQIICVYNDGDKDLVNKTLSVYKPDTRQTTSADDNEAATVTPCIGILLILSLLPLMVANFY